MPKTCPACGMRQFCAGEIKTYETDWNRKGHGQHLTEAQAISRVCRHNKVGGCLTKGLPMPLPELVAPCFMDDGERAAAVAQILHQLGANQDAA